MSREAPSKETQSILRRDWFLSVQEISDIQLQRRTWLDPNNRNPHWSYIELCCCYPADDQLEDGRRWEYLSVEELELLQKLGNALAVHQAPGGNGYDNAAIVDDPAWHEVVALAEHVRHSLLALVDDPLERRALTRDAVD
jgi:hypothetical protein